MRAILDAALAELERHGFVDMRIDDVARAARVNKTSVYRRWHTKSELVLAALTAAHQEEPRLVETGHLRSDLVKLLAQKGAVLATPKNRKICHALMAVGDGELDQLTRKLRKARYSVPRGLVERAIDRGELPASVPAEFVVDLLAGTMLYRALIANQPLSIRYIERLVDWVLAGAPSAGHAARKAGPARTRDRKVAAE